MRNFNFYRCNHCCCAGDILTFSDFMTVDEGERGRDSVREAEKMHRHVAFGKTWLENGFE